MINGSSVVKNYVCPNCQGQNVTQHQSPLGYENRVRVCPDCHKVWDEHEYVRRTKSPKIICPNCGYGPRSIMIVDGIDLECQACGTIWMEDIDEGYRG